MMYYGIATRVAGTGEDIDRVRRVFDWVVRQVQLVPPGALAAGRLPHVFARPYDVLLRGMATEAEGFWAERAWLFMAAVSPTGYRHRLDHLYQERDARARGAEYGSIESRPPWSARKPPKPPIIWICAALIDDKAYLFDARRRPRSPGSRRLRAWRRSIKPWPTRRSSSG